MGDSKQVKVDNWGIFFLQRLQTFFNKTYFCDLTLQFEDNVQLKVHRLVMNACTEYFQVLEQTCEVINDCLIMPPDLQADVVVPIVNFMYSGILEFQTSIFDRLYSTARLMNMTVLTKLLDAQKVPISPIPKPLNKRTPVTPITWNLQGKKIAPKTMDPDLPETLPGRKLPIWKRKSVPSTLAYRSDIITGIPDPLSSKYFRSNVEEPPKPTRFEWPEDDDTSFDTNSFDEISYTSKPIVIPHREKSPKPSTSSNNFEELKRTSVAVKRAASPVYSESKKVNIQDVKEYIKEQKLRSDYIDYDDSEAADNDLQTYENDNDSDDENKEDIFDQNAEDTPNKSILKNDSSTPHNKRVRFSLEGKENAASKTPQKPASAAATIKTNSSSVDVTNHTKIITEVLKKYPHLVKKNKNIKLKILAKGANVGSAGLKPIGTPVKVVKPTTKVSYMVKKPSETNNKSGSVDIKKDGHWSCHRCSNPNPLIFETYYLYRKHLTEIHNEKTDSQMCNICGHVSRKQNMLIYHKLIKHNITPPPSYQFPKCKDCSYIALSQAMLVKHQINHTHQNNICSECNTTFTTKSALISHVQLTGHTGKNNCPTFDCTYCTKKFISDETLFQHIKNNHKDEARRDYIISPVEEDDSELKEENVITAEEIDALEEPGESSQQEVIINKSEPMVEKSKEKIKILSDVKVSSAKQPVKVMSTETTSAADSQSLEPSSEAESLSNVASGIAASLGLVNTIVVLDENQFILQSPDGNQENIIANPQNIILPDVTNINNIQNLVSQHHQVITTDANTIISQATLAKNNITSTDELVMVLTDHDYSDASNNTVITSENSNIVVLYSHPVQSQDGQFISQSSNLMINSDMGLVEVGNNYAVANTVSMDDKQCEESIELIQQEINNHLESESHEIPQPTEKIVEEQVIGYEEVKSDSVIQQSELRLQGIPKAVLPDESEKMEVDPIEDITENHTPNVELTSFSKSPEIRVPSQNEVITIPNDPELPKPVSEEQSLPQNTGDNHFEEPMEIEESIEMIQQEIHRSSTEAREIPPVHQETTSEDIPPRNLQEIVQEKTLKEENVEPVQEILETEIDEPAIIKESEAEECEERKDINNESHEEEIEHMEVDSANLVTNENIQVQNIESETTCNNIKDEQTESTLNNVEGDQSEIINSSIPEDKPECVEDPSSQEETTVQQVELLSQEETTEQVNEVLPQEEITEHQLKEPVVIPEENQKQINEDNTLEISKTLLPESIEKEISHLMEENPVEPKTEVTNEPEDIQEIVESPVEAEVIEEPKDSNENSTPEESQDSDGSQEKEKIILPEDSNEVKVVTSEESTTKDVKIILDDWDDGDTDSQQSDTPKPTPVSEESRTVVNTLINDWEDEEET